MCILLIRYAYQITLINFTMLDFLWWLNFIWKFTPIFFSFDFNSKFFSFNQRLIKIVSEKLSNLFY